MSTKQTLIKELDQIVELTTKQNYHYVRGRSYLYEGFATVYLWWLKAKEVKGFLDEQYKLHNIGGKEHEQEKFTRVLRLTWRLDWADESKAKLQQWSNALRKLDEEYKGNKDAYRTDAKKKLVLFIEDKGGLRKLIGADKYDYDGDNNTEVKSKRKATRSNEEEAMLAARHLQLGKEYFDNAAAISNIQSTKPIYVNRTGYAIALIRKRRGEKYDVLATLDDESQVEQAIIASYKRDDAVAPNVLRLLTEVIHTQSLPVAMQSVRHSLADTVKVVNEDGTVQKRTQNKRVLFRKRHKDILLSENRTGCSVVSLVKPKVPVLASSKDVFLNVNDRRYLEEAIIQRDELNLYTTNDKEKVPVLRDTSKVASHRLVVENKVLAKKRAIYFYALDSVGETSRPQACIKSSKTTTATLTATVNKLWIERVNALFVSSWLREYGEKITWAKHKLMGLEFDTKKLVIKHYGERANFSNSSLPIELPKAATGKSIKAVFQSKDIVPVLNGLADIDVIGNISLALSAYTLTLTFKTELADYKIFVPTCNAAGKRNSTDFEAYGG